jgi:hypothetical protein
MIEESICCCSKEGKEYSDKGPCPVEGAAISRIEEVPLSSCENPEEGNVDDVRNC